MSAIMRIIDPTIDKLLDSSGGNLRSLINDALMEMIGDTFRNSKDPEKARKVKVELKLVRLDQQGIFKVDWKVQTVPAPYELGEEDNVPERQQSFDLETGEVTE